MAKLFDFLPGEGQAYNLIRSLVKTPLGFAEIQQQVADAGYTVRGDLVNQIVGYYRSATGQAAQYASSLNLNAKPNINKLPQTTTKIGKNFVYVVNLKGTQFGGGGDIQQYITVSSSKLITKQQAIDTAMELGGNPDAQYGILAESGQVQEIYQNSGGIDYSLL